MNGIEALLSIGSSSGIAPAAAPPVALGQAPPSLAAGGASFADLVSGGLRQIDQRVASADALVRSFALDDNVPLHQVTFALEQARLSVELAMQVQTRLVEGYRQLMNMQL
jgi:flagellar hook-basal body complex protein FliE